MDLSVKRIEDVCNAFLSRKSRRSTAQRRLMSYVTATCLSNKDVLFVADKNAVYLDMAGNSLGRSATIVKLRNYSNGVIGFAGNTEIAMSMIGLLSPIQDNRKTAIILRKQLVELYQQVTGLMPTDTNGANNGNGVEFIFSNGDGIYTFSSQDSFRASLDTRYAAIGMTMIGLVIYHMFKGYRALELEHAKRIAALQVLIQSEEIEQEKRRNALRDSLEYEEIQCVKRRLALYGDSIAESERCWAELRIAAALDPAEELEQEKRMAALRVSLTSDASPTSVSPEMDMWLLRHGNSEPDILTDVVDVQKEIRDFRAQMIKGLYTVPRKRKKK